MTIAGVGVIQTSKMYDIIYGSSLRQTSNKVINQTRNKRQWRQVEEEDAHKEEMELEDLPPVS